MDHDMSSDVEDRYVLIIIQHVIANYKVIQTTY